MTYESSVVYAEDPELAAYGSAALTPQLIRSWYEWRARSITKATSLPEFGLELLQKEIHDMLLKPLRFLYIRVSPRRNQGLILRP